jgi:hypothetical protein
LNKIFCLPVYNLGIQTLKHKPVIVFVVLRGYEGRFDSMFLASRKDGVWKCCVEGDIWA